MHPSKYEILLKVAETESFTKTAEYFQYTQSAISQMVKSIEDTYKITLFQRTKTGLKITEEGKMILPNVRMIVEGQRNLQEQINEIHHMQKGVIRIGSYLSLATHMVPKCIRSFLDDYPHVQFELIQEDDKTLYEKIRDGEIDIALMCDPKKRDVTFEALFYDPFQIVLPASHPYAFKDTIDLRDMKDEDFIFLNVGYSSYFEKMFQDAGYKPKVKYEMIDDLSTLAMVDQELGVTILPKFTATSHPFNLKIKDMSKEYDRVVGFVTRKNGFSSWAVRGFKDYVIHHIPDGFEKSDILRD